MWIASNNIARTMIWLVVFATPSLGLPSISCGCDVSILSTATSNGGCCCVKATDSARKCCQAKRSKTSCCKKDAGTSSSCTCGASCKCNSDRKEPVAPPANSNSFKKLGTDATHSPSGTGFLLMANASHVADSNAAMEIAARTDLYIVLCRFTL